MGSKHGSKGLLAMVLLVVFFGLTKGKINKDKQQCRDHEVVWLTSCLPYVDGEAKAPTIDCCDGLKLVLVKRKVCLCILISDHNNTLALGLPGLCQTPYNVSVCIGYTKHNKPKKKTMALHAGGARNKHTKSSDGGRRMGWLGIELAGLLLNTMMFH